MKTKVTVNTRLACDINQAWVYFTDPKHIVNWYFAHESWHVPFATNDLEVGKEFHIQMEAKDKSGGFDFWGTYDKIVPYKEIKATLGDGRSLEVLFDETNQGVHISQTFEIEDEHSKDLQQQGWQAILNQLKTYVESL